MTNTLDAALFTSSRRVQLVFSGALDTSAYTSTAYYAVDNADGTGPSPINVLAAYMVVGTPGGLELAVDEDWQPGALYTVTVTAVPFADTSTFTGSIDSRVGLPLVSPLNAEPAQDDLVLILYGRDIAHNGVDFLEDASGDLLTVSGRPNWLAANWRRMTSPGLPWDVSYGAKPDQYVDAPQPYQLPLAGTLLAQARADDRTLRATVDVVQGSDPADWFFNMTIIGRDGLDPQTLHIPVP